MKDFIFAVISLFILPIGTNAFGAVSVARDWKSLIHPAGSQNSSVVLLAARGGQGKGKGKPSAPVPPPACTPTSCQTGLICNAGTGNCEPVSCVNNGDQDCIDAGLPSHFICDATLKVCVPGCDPAIPDSCPVGEVCQSGYCIPDTVVTPDPQDPTKPPDVVTTPEPECTIDDECKAISEGLHCDAGHCVPYFCGVDSDCDAAGLKGYVCDPTQKICVPQDPPVTAPSSGCMTDADCPTGQLCNPFTHRCIDPSSVNIIL